jgi:NAD(P)H-dependent FMN reductase
MSKLHIIIASTRPGRAADFVYPWVVARATAHGAFEVEVLDLRDWRLPMFGEHAGTIGDFNDPTYSDPIVRRWNQKMKEADAFLFITPEYNHSVPGVLKNAIDSVFLSFALRNKPSAMIGYSGGIAAGVRAIEHLAHIVIEGDGVPLRSTVIIPFVGAAFEGEVPKDRMADVALGILLDDLAWWSTALEQARAAGELAPAVFRARAAMAAPKK